MTFEMEGLNKTNCPPWLLLLSFAERSHRVVLCLAIISGMVSGAIFPIFAVLLGNMFKAFSDHGSEQLAPEDFGSAVAQNTTYLVVFAVMSWLLHAAFFTLSSIFGDLQGNSARIQVYDRVLHKEMAWLDTRKHGLSSLLIDLQR